MNLAAPYSVALVAGMVAAVNPCGFALLPAYLSLLIAGKDAGRGSRPAAVWRAVRMTAAMTGGFVAVFGLFGLVVVAFSVAIAAYLPLVTIVIGGILVGLGAWLLAGRELFLAMPKLRSGAPTGSMASMGLYGVSYAIASLSCTVGPFVAVTTTTFRSASVLAGMGAFVTYAAGMGLVVGVLAVAVALARHAVVTRAKRVLRYVSRASGGLLVAAGVYVAYYGAYELRVFAGGGAGDPIVGAATRLQQALSRSVIAAGPGWFALAMIALVAGGIGAGRMRRRRLRAPDSSAGEPPAPRG